MQDNLKFLMMTASAVILLSSCGKADTVTAYESASRPTSEVILSASEAVKSSHNEISSYLNMADKKDIERAEKGFIAALEGSQIKTNGDVVNYDFAAYDFLNGETANTVNPSLWRQSSLNAKHGLFEVKDGIYQIRGYDISNITFIRGETGWIVVDPLLSKETAAAAKSLIDKHLGELPVSAMIFTHSHADHFGGVRGLIDEQDVERGVQIIAPANFVLETISENLLAGNAMTRRASYMFGGLLPKNAQQQVGVGLGPALSNGNVGLMQPTLSITESGEIHVVDGVEMEFIMALGAEAPSEFMFYMPEYKAFCQAEIINHTLHNLYTPRGAKVRDGRLWSKYIDEAVYKYADVTDVSFGSHNWPVWGSEDVRAFWEGQRDLYRFIHDQTVRKANNGATMHEIPALLNMPDGIAKSFANRGYYGTVSHNSKAQYQLYFGYFDGNPANLDPLPPVEESKKFVDYMGGADAILKNAEADYEAGEYRFAATALNKLVFAEPDNKAATTLLANVYTQLAYMAESGSWRNFYLTGAEELRNGVKVLPTVSTNGPDIVSAVPLDLYFDLLAVRLNSEKAGEQDRHLNFEVVDTNQKAHLFISNGALHHRMGQSSEDAPTLKITRAALDALNLKSKTFPELMQNGALTFDGDIAGVQGFFNLIEEPTFWFEIIRP